ncbi:MAG: heparinase II/III family protein [Bryobacteraceae bacterium]|nr:heparinase II/III family protein [Bryobacteraceae bacterium]
MKFWLAFLIGTIAVFAQPRLFVNDADVERIRTMAVTERWADAALATILRIADTFPQAHLTRFGLKTLELPPDGGQWYHWYVCPTHGVRLAYTAPNTHRCTVDNRTFSGWPYDQYIYSNRNDDLAASARDLALAYRFTGRREYAVHAANILKMYADKYLTWRLHDKDNRTAASGARAFSQTLDESIWLIPMAWAYDLLSGTDVLTAEERSRIERDLLRAAVDTILRNDANISNWQSWHNAGIAAVGFALADNALITRAIDGKSGFRFQMKNSVVGEGFWYEGAWGYHFYALDALVQTAEMAARNGIDLWTSEPNLANLFRAPLNLAFADNNLPAFNDSGTLNLLSYDRLYEAAYARTQDPLLLSVLGKRTRGREAMMWGQEQLPESAAIKLESNVFSDSGFAVLRAATNDHAVMMKFGPHGGGHGHYDKLGFVSFARGGPLAVDPGTQAYGAPTHATWDQTTVAHNTLVLDEAQQAQSEGKLLFFQKEDGFVAASSDAGPAYRNAELQRTMLHTADYTLDIANARSTNDTNRTVDWVYHNYGTLNVALAMEPWTGFGKSNGYQHLTRNTSRTTGEAWQATFDGAPRTAVTYGSTFGNVAGVQGRYEVTPEQSLSGRFSGRMSYNFTAAQGYILYTTPTLAPARKGAPTGLSVQIWGDGSGHRSRVAHQRHNR